MGKKGSWFSAIIKRLFTPKSSKDKEVSKKKSKGKRHGESKSFIPLLREPSSIEKILEEAAADEPIFSSFGRPPQSSPNITSPRPATSPRVTSQRADSSGASSSKARRKHEEDNRYVHRPEPASEGLHAKAIKIQTAFRGYMARRRLRGLVRLQGVMRGNNARKQSLNALKQMQFVVRVQTQIQCRRIQMLENQALQSQLFKNGNSTSNWTELTGAGNTENWDDSLLTKDEIERRWRRKAEAIAKRERAMAYAYSKHHHHHQKGSSQRWGLYPTIIWWNWLDDHRDASDKNALPTPTSTKSAAPTGSKQFEDSCGRTPTPPPSSSGSLTSCPPFSAPSYMATTASAKAKAKVRERHNIESYPVGESSKRRFSYPLTPQNNVEREGEVRGGDAVSVDCSVSMSAAADASSGRKPFNRFG